MLRDQGIRDLHFLPSACLTTDRDHRLSIPPFPFPSYSLPSLLNLLNHARAFSSLLALSRAMRRRRSTVMVRKSFSQSNKVESTLSDCQCCQILLLAWPGLCVVVFHPDSRCQACPQRARTMLENVQLHHTSDTITFAVSS